MLVIRSITDQSSGEGHIEKLTFQMAAPKVGLTDATFYSGLVDRKLQKGPCPQIKSLVLCVISTA